MVTYFEDFSFAQFFVRYLSLFGMQMSKIYVTYILFISEFNSLKCMKKSGVVRGDIYSIAM